MHIFFLFITLSFFSCKEQKQNFNTDELIGVWSGLLFQTESEFNSIILNPAENPSEVILYWRDGHSQTYSLSVEDNKYFFKDSDGLRFDAFYDENKNNLYGLITNNLWVQSLNFKNSGGRWVSEILKPEIIDTDYLVYLEFYYDSLGQVQANIQSNKENRRLHFIINEVIINGGEIDFNISNDNFNISAEYIKEEKNLLLTYGNSGGEKEIKLKKLKEDELEGFLPLNPAEQYVYKKPSIPDDEWNTASLEEAGIDSSLLGLIPEIRGGGYNHIHSIIITKNNKLVFEEYFHGYNREKIHDLRSAFKSFSSLLTGKILNSKSGVGLNSSIVDFYPEYEITDRQKKNITIYHALTMSTGLKLENEDQMQWESDDWVKYKLTLPLEYKPGEKYEYSSGGTHLLSGVLEKITGEYLPLYLYKEILLPMNINKFQMLTSPMGRGYLAGNFYLRPIDFAKFGTLVLNKGKWKNKQIIPGNWIDESTTFHIKGSWPKDSGYGFLWRILERKINDKIYKTIEAWGNGGQFLIIIPELEITITFTGGNYNLFPEMEEMPFKILNKFILPAVIK